VTTKVEIRRMSVEMDGEFVVFIIGMRVNQFWKPWKWLPVFMAMRPMIMELMKDPESGFLGAEQKVTPRSPLVIQYWRSFEQLERYARSKDGKHFPAWVNFNKKVAASGAVGIWHETYRVRPGDYEAIYQHMRPYGFGKVGRLVPAAGRHASAAGRMTGEEAAPAVDEAGTLVAG
jgi:hypothetical protein